jgi:superkiller protein 3
VESDARKRLEKAKEALKEDPKNWTLLDEKLDALMHLRLYRDALELTTFMIEQWPEGAGAYYNHGFALRFLGKTNEAELALRRALELKPEFPSAYIELCNVYWADDRFADAEWALRQCLEIRPDDSEALDRLAPVLGAQLRYEESKEVCRRIIEADPDNAPAYVNLGIALHALGDNAEAVNAYEKAEQLDPTRETIFYNHGRLLFQMGQFRDALPILYKAAELDPQDPDAWSLIAQVHNELGDADAEKDALRQLLDRDPTSTWAYFQLCILAFNGDDDDELERVARFGLEHDPEHHGLLHYLGVALNARQAFPEALDAFRKAIAADPNDPATRYEFGTALADSGQVLEACAEWERVLSTASDEDLLAAAQEMLDSYTDPNSHE